jgi:hypothetical protein
MEMEGIKYAMFCSVKLKIPWNCSAILLTIVTCHNYTSKERDIIDAYANCMRENK